MPAHPTARGALLLVAAMACFSTSDVLAKHLSPHFPPVVLAWCRYALLLATVLPLALRHPGSWRSAKPWWQLARAAGLIASALFFLFALRALPVAEATAMVFASPLFVTVLAAVVLHETVPWPRWLPVLLGFAGVLVVVRPGSSVFGAAALLPILSSMAWATAVVCTRKLGASDSAATTMLYSGIAGAAVLSLLVLGEPVAALAQHALPLAAMAAAWCAAQWLTIAAYRSAAAASIAPYAYSQLLWSALLGVVIFGHVPDAVSLAGMAIILASGGLAALLASRHGTLVPQQ